MKPAPASRARRIARGLLAALGATLVALLLCELGFRVWHYGPRAFSPAWMNSLHSMGESGLLQASDVPELGYGLVPNVRARLRMAHHVTNAQGLRDEETPFEKPPGTFRIAAVGDSFTMGYGLELEDVYHSVLERELGRDPGGPRYECVNFGVAGYGLEQYVAVVRHLVGRYDPDLVLVAVNGTDRAPSRTGPFTPRPVARPFFQLSILQELRRRWHRASHGEEVMAPRREEWEAAPPEGEPMDRRTMSFLREQMSELARAAERAGAPVVVVHLRAEALPGGEDSRVTAGFRVAAEEAGLAYLDASKPFAGEDLRDYAVAHDDTHPNAAAHARFAEEIRAFLAARGLVPGAGEVRQGH